MDHHWPRHGNKLRRAQRYRWRGLLRHSQRGHSTLAGLGRHRFPGRAQRRRRDGRSGCHRTEQLQHRRQLRPEHERQHESPRDPDGRQPAQRRHLDGQPGGLVSQHRRQSAELQRRHAQGDRCECRRQLPQRYFRAGHDQGRFHLLRRRDHRRQRHGHHDRQFPPCAHRQRRLYDRRGQRRIGLRRRRRW